MKQHTIAQNWKPAKTPSKALGKQPYPSTNYEPKQPAQRQGSDAFMHIQRRGLFV